MVLDRARFVLGREGLFPGFLSPFDSRLDHVPLHIEIRSPSDKNLPVEHLKSLNPSQRDILLDMGLMKHESVLDAFMLGFDRVTIDSRSEIRELGLAHAVSSKVVTRLVLENSLQELPKDIPMILGHLENLREIVPSHLLLVTRHNGVMTKFFDLAGSNAVCSWEWHLAPAEGCRVETGTLCPASWAIIHEELVGDA